MGFIDSFSLLMTKHSLSVTKLSEVTGIHRSAIYGFLSGETDISYKKLLRLLETLNIDLELILKNKVFENLQESLGNSNIGMDLEYALSCLDKSESRTHIKSLMRAGDLEVAQTTDDRLKQALTNINKFYFEEGGNIVEC